METTSTLIEADECTAYNARNEEQSHLNHTKVTLTIPCNSLQTIRKVWNCFYRIGSNNSNRIRWGHKKPIRGYVSTKAFCKICPPPENIASTFYPGSCYDQHHHQQHHQIQVVQLRSFYPIPCAEPTP